MDQDEIPQVNDHDTAGTPETETPARRSGISRRQVIRYGAGGLASLSLGGAAAWYFRDLTERAAAAEVFKNDAPKGELWEAWKRRGWAREAKHYLKLEENIQCQLCPNECVLEPEDRGRCRNRVYKEGKLYTMAYGNPCSFQVDAIEKKPLYHFLPGTRVYSIATSGCGFRCLNCQNWETSQRKPEETKDPRGDEIRLTSRTEHLARGSAQYRMSLFPEDLMEICDFYQYPSVAYTYTEPTVWYEYMVDTAAAAREKNIKNVWVTCGYIREEPLRELCRVIDAANVDLKSFDEEIYRELNSGKLEPILRTLEILKEEGVWFEVTHLVVPNYLTEDEDSIKVDLTRRMCDWLVEKLGPDCPLHLSRFTPRHKLTHLPPTPPKILDQARSIAREAGLRYVYVGNCPEVENAGTTFCPNCRQPVIERHHYSTKLVNFANGKCGGCATRSAGVWS